MPSSETKQSGASWHAVAQELRKTPGKRVVVAQSATSSTAQSLRHKGLNVELEPVERVQTSSSEYTRYRITAWWPELDIQDELDRVTLELSRTQEELEHLRTLQQSLQAALEAERSLA